jgi:hypothetical protein
MSLSDFNSYLLGSGFVPFTVFIDSINTAESSPGLTAYTIEVFFGCIKEECPWP